MEFKTINQWDEAMWQRTKDIYLDAFEKHGGKPEKIIRNMFAKGLCCLHVLQENGTIAAMALSGLLEGTEIILIDYFAVKQQYRGQGVGQKFSTILWSGPVQTRK